MSVFKKPDAHRRARAHTHVIYKCVVAYDSSTILASDLLAKVEVRINIFIKYPGGWNFHFTPEGRNIFQIMMIYGLYQRYGHGICYITYTKYLFCQI